MTVYISYPDSEHMVVQVDRTHIIEANHDEHGWAGMKAIEETARKMAKALGAEVIVK